MISTNCTVCHGVVEVDVDQQIWDYIRKAAPNCVAKYTCENCSKQIAEARSVEVEQNRELESAASEEVRSEYYESLWAKVCPGEFNRFDANRYPKASQRSLERVRAWRHDLPTNPRGMMLHGKSGSGKTVAVWSALRAPLFAGVDIEAFTANRFAVEAARLAGESSERSAKWLHKLKAVTILFIDDIGKREMTEFSEAQLFDVIDHRYANGLPMIFTCEGNSKWLSRFIGESRRDGMIRRIVESCQDISF